MAGWLGLGTKVMSLPVFSNGTRACSNSPLAGAYTAVALMNIFINRMLEEPSQRNDTLLLRFTEMYGFVAALVD